MALDIHRQQAFHGLFSSGGALISASVCSTASGHSDPDAVSYDVAQFLIDAGEARLLRPPEYALKEFSTASLGSLCFWYQNFWEFDETPGALAEFERACQQAVQSKRFPENPHRLVILPAIARIHALTNARPEAIADHSDVIRRCHAAALDPTSALPSREILEGIWQNATAALIRNESSWQHTTFDASLVAEARNVLFAFLNVDEYLLVPALSAWHFLLTYETALRARPEASVLPAVRAVIDEVLGHPMGGKSYWFTRLQALLMGRAGRASAVPQLNEVLMSLGAPDRENLPNSEIVDLFTLARLEQAYLRAQGQAGYLKTPYLWPQRIVSRTQGFLVEYGFGPEHLKRLQVGLVAKESRLGPTEESADFWEDELGKPPPPKEVASSTTKRPVSPETLAKILPFNRAEAHRIVRLGYPARLPLSDISEMILADIRKGSIHQFLSHQFAQMVKAFKGTLPDLQGINPAEQTEQALQSLDQQAVKRAWETLERRLDELKSPRVMITGVSIPPNLDNMPLRQEGPMFASEELAQAFDEAAERIFAKIPEIERAEHNNELVFISPYAKPSDGGPLYVFGKTLMEILKQADKRFGARTPGELMSLATKDGSVPEEKLLAMRCL